jgi:hypothetical protein
MFVLCFFWVCVFLITLSCVSIKKGLCMDNNLKKTMLLQTCNISTRNNKYYVYIYMQTLGSFGAGNKPFWKKMALAPDLISPHASFVSIRLLPQCTGRAARSNRKSRRMFA